MLKNELDKNINEEIIDNNEIEPIVENEAFEELSTDDLIDTVHALMERIDAYKVDVNVDDVQNLQLDKTNFKKGIKGISEICGQYSALKAVGMDEESALTIINSLLNAEYSCKLQKILSDSSIEISKNQTNLISSATID